MFFRKKFLAFVVLILSLALLTGCSKTATNTQEPQSITLKYAQGFKIENLSDGYKVVTDGENRRILLVPKGKEVPSDYKDMPVVYTPVERVVVASTTFASAMRPLRVLNSIVGVNADKDQWYIEEVKKGIENGSIQVVGSGMGQLDYDKIVALKPDLVLIYTGSGASDAQTLQKLEELDVPVAVDNEWLENDPLARLEWVKFIAAFYNKEKEAEEFFNNVEKKIDEVKAKVSEAKAKPKVLWGLLYQGKVYVSGGDSYVAKMVDMAGGDYLFKDSKGGSISIEEFYVRGKDADVFIHSSILGETIADIVNQGKILADFPAIKNGKVWDFQPWYWQSVDKTDEIIEDLAAIFYPELFFKDHQLRHFKKVPEK